MYYNETNFILNNMKKLFISLLVLRDYDMNYEKTPGSKFMKPGFKVFKV